MRMLSAGMRGRRIEEATAGVPYQSSFCSPWMVKGLPPNVKQTSCALTT
jgi:hypothetical protein